MWGAHPLVSVVVQVACYLPLACDVRHLQFAQLLVGAALEPCATYAFRTWPLNSSHADGPAAHHPRHSQLFLCLWTAHSPCIQTLHIDGVCKCSHPTLTHCAVHSCFIILMVT